MKNGEEGKKQFVIESWQTWQIMKNEMGGKHSILDRQCLCACERVCIHDNIRDHPCN